jgi:hypothetical protein
MRRCLVSKPINEVARPEAQLIVHSSPLTTLAWLNPQLCGKISIGIAEGSTDGVLGIKPCKVGRISIVLFENDVDLISINSNLR